MRVLTKVSHDDRQLGEVYTLKAGELLDRLLAAGVVVPAAEWAYEHIEAPRSGTGDQQHRFTRIAPDPNAEVAPAADVRPDEPRMFEEAPEPTTQDPPALDTRGGE